MDSRTKKKEVLALLFVLLFYTGPVLLFFFGFFIIFFTSLWPILLVYWAWYYFDRETPFKQGRSWSWLRSAPLWNYYRSYFPQKFVQASKLPPNRNYIFCLFPHGILFSGAFAHFTSLNSDFYKENPGISVSGHTLDSNFSVPVFRDYLMALGFCSVSKKTLLYKLSNTDGGHAVFILVGGSAEAMKSKPGETYRLVLKSRKGFVKVALETGASLVPVFLFGEMNLYSHWMFPEDSWIYRLQQTIRKHTGVAPCVINGTGIFQRYFGILPQRKPVTTVMGEPIHLDKVASPTREQVDDLHKKFTNEISKLFEENKWKYLEKPEEAFLIIED